MEQPTEGLVDRGFRILRQFKDGTDRIEVWARPPAITVLVIRYGDSRGGWNIYLEADDSNSTDKTWDAVDAAIGALTSENVTWREPHAC